MREMDDRVVGGAIRKLADLDDESVAEAQEVDAIEGVGGAAAALAQGLRAMRRGLVAVDENATNHRLLKHIINMALVKRFTQRLFADDASWIACVSPSRIREADDFGRDERKHSVNIVADLAREKFIHQLKDEFSIPLAKSPRCFQCLQVQFSQCRRVAPHSVWRGCLTVDTL